MQTVYSPKEKGVPCPERSQIIEFKSLNYYEETALKSHRILTGRRYLVLRRGLGVRYVGECRRR